MTLNDLTMLTKYNFATRRFKENGNVYFDIVSTEEEKVYRVPEDLVKQILIGRKYRIVNLKLENGDVVLKDTSEDLAVVKDISFPFELFKEMNEPFVELFFKLVKRKINYIHRQTFPQYKDKLTVIDRQSIAYKDECVFNLRIRIKGDCRYDFTIFIREDSPCFIIDMLGRTEGEIATIAHSDITGYTSDKYRILLDYTLNKFL